MLRAGIGDAELLDHLRRAIALKPRGHDFTDQPAKVTRLMAQTGG
jgi:cyclic pyranopterin phosphate synthase